MPYRLLLLLPFMLTCLQSRSQDKPVTVNEPAASGDRYRPQFHFTPKEHWMNDPNGMFLLDGVYNLYFQYYPADTKWGPMHWGHATSTDLVTWKEQPIALFPDSLGYIFSGSAVVDKNNTSGFGKNGITPIVAIFTYHDPLGEKAKRNDYQTQGIAYSLDKGMTWTKYAGNPVLKNPGIIDFRDPKVNWNTKIKKWVMTLATKDRISFYSSPDLKTWTKLSEFGEKLGAHGGVWECPDLFPLKYKGRDVWVLLVSINPGGPNGGSATQYFLGDFNGRQFIPSDTSTRFIDYGTDNYAGVTISNTGSRTIFLGWMSNWLYGEKVPTEKWRSAMTIPRELSLKEAKGKPYLASMPVKELDKVGGAPYDITRITNPATPVVMDFTDNLFQFDFTIAAETFEVELIGSDTEKLKLGFDKPSGRFYIDRTNAGVSSFNSGFATRHWAPRIRKSPFIKMRLVVDVASVEMFADDGLTVMTDIFFRESPARSISISSPQSGSMTGKHYHPFKKIAGR